MMAKLYVKPGDRFFRVTKGHRMNDEPRTDWVVVTKVGRKWAEFQPEGVTSPHLGGRFDLETGRVDGRGYSSGSTVHGDEAAWRANVAANDAFRRFTDALRYGCRQPGVTEADILTAAELLKLDIKP